MTRASKQSPWASTRDRDAEREEKIEALLDAAAAAFSENGYHRTSLGSIADRLGITKPTLYYYCSGKEDLMMKVSSRGLDRILSDVGADIHSSGLDQLRAMLRRMVEWVATDSGKTTVLLNDSDLSEPNSTEVVRRKRAIDRQIRTLLAKGVADHSIAPCDVRLSALMLASAISGIARWYKSGSDLSATALSEIFVNQLTMGLKPRE